MAVVITTHDPAVVRQSQVRRCAALGLCVHASHFRYELAGGLRSSRGCGAVKPVQRSKVVLLFSRDYVGFAIYTH